MSDPKAAIIEEITREGMQMAIEANSAAMIVFNAKVQKIADAVGVDISEVELTEVEERNKTQMLESVGKRLMRIMQLSAEAEGQPAPSPEEAAAALEAVKDEIWPDGSVTGTQEKSDDAPTSEWDGPPLRQEADGSVYTADGRLFAKLRPSEPAPEVDNIFTEDGRAEPGDYLPVGMEVADDKTVEDCKPKFDNAGPFDTAPEIIAQQQAAEEPLFKSYRAAEEQAKLEEALQPPAFTVYTWGGEDDEGFGEVDFTDHESRLTAWKGIVMFYCDEAQAAVQTNWLSQPLADRLKQEFASNPDNPVTSDIPLPEPGDVSNGVLATVAEGENVIEITGMDSETQVAEAIMTAFMITATRFNQAIGAALLDKRLAQLGMTT